MKAFTLAPDAGRRTVGEARSMDTSTKHTIATLMLCAAIVVVTAVALLAMSPTP